MTACCDDYGQCTRGPDCPAREKALREFYKPNYCQKVQMFDKPSRLNRCLDWVGNLPHRFGRWVDRSAAGQRFCLALGGVLACGLAALVVFR